MTLTLLKSYGFPLSSALSKASNIGFANASPTITIFVVLVSSTCVHIWSGSNPKLRDVTAVPPRRRGKKAPSHIPVPCISGHPIKLFMNVLSFLKLCICSSRLFISSGTS